MLAELVVFLVMAGASLGTIALICRLTPRHRKPRIALVPPPDAPVLSTEWGEGSGGTTSKWR